MLRKPRGHRGARGPDSAARPRHTEQVMLNNNWRHPIAYLKNLRLLVLRRVVGEDLEGRLRGRRVLCDLPDPKGAVFVKLCGALLQRRLLG